MKYHFKSINTWLMGICKSFCPEHSWRSSAYDPGKKSIFAEDEEDQCQAAEEEEGSSQEQTEKENCPSPSVCISKDEQIPRDEIQAAKKNCKRIEDELKNTQFRYTCLEDEESIKEFASRREEPPDNDLCDYEQLFDKELIDYDKTNCSCPECCPIESINCIHNQVKLDHESGICNLEDMSASELTSSLECFEVIASPECRREVEQTIATCPTEKAEPNGNSGSSSPSKDDSPSEGGFAQTMHVIVAMVKHNR